MLRRAAIACTVVALWLILASISPACINPVGAAVANVVFMAVGLIVYVCEEAPDGK